MGIYSGGFFNEPPVEIYFYTRFLFWGPPFHFYWRVITKTASKKSRRREKSSFYWWTREPSCSGASANCLGTATRTTVASMSYPNIATCKMEYMYYKMRLLNNLGNTRYYARYSCIMWCSIRVGIQVLQDEALKESRNY
jgi:hypothetical protein